MLDFSKINYDLQMHLYYKKVIEDSNNEDIYAINVLAHLQRKEKRYEEALETLSRTDSTADVSKKLLTSS